MAYFNAVCEALTNIDNPKYKGQPLFILCGSGRTGKTFISNSLIHWANSKGIHWANSKGIGVTACASTRIAARLLIASQTTHSTFRIMNNIEPLQPSTMVFKSVNAQKLHSTSLFIIDE
uniref:ATP-dependent DNA helicase n=1 Tax=Romanomermis culicivorax TaxID=13658 RepID=A0A915KAJ6_ROMCU